MTKNYCVPSVSANREYLMTMLNRQDFTGKYLLVKEAMDQYGFRGRWQ